MVRPTYVTKCVGCQKRIHAPTPESFIRQKVRHLRNCAALRKSPAVPE